MSPPDGAVLVIERIDWVRLADELGPLSPSAPQRTMKLRRSLRRISRR